MKRRWIIVAMVIALALLLFASCTLAAIRSTNQNLRGRMLLWHALNPSETEALNAVIDSFTELNPDVSVKVQAFSTTVELNDQFVNSARSGFGPDLILAPSTWVRPLAEARLISPVDEHLTEAVIARFNPAILSTLHLDGQTYGIPQSLDTLALYVNRQIVETPATTFPTLLEQANAGTTVLLPINFVDAFWGIQAFGGQLFDEEGKAILNRGGFANWLAWLREARNAPGMIQDTNRDLLRQRFITGGAGYYIGYASELNTILAALGRENVTVLPLPSGPVGPAGPFVHSQAFLFSSVSSENQRLLAAELAKFITNAEQSSRLMRLVNHVPANTTVRINPRLDPIVAAFANQARNGIPLPTREEFDAVLRLGNEAYIRALEGGEPPAEVAFAFTNSVNRANNFETQSEPSYACSGLGTILLAHSWQRLEALAALDTIIANFREKCPLIIVETAAIAPDEVGEQFSLPQAGGFRPAFGIVTQEQLAQLLMPESQVKGLGESVDATLLQRFAPIGVAAMRSQGALYALPLALHVDALYYNRQLVSTPAQTLDDLRAEAMAGIPITLDTRFANAFWGLRAFGGQIFADDGAAILDQGGFADWLHWLRESRDNYGIQLSNDGDELLRRFLAGESAYYVAGPDELSTLQEALGENLGVALLPGGPGGPAQPLATAEGFVLRKGITAAAENLALEFMRFATEVESETILMAEANKIPANANVSATGSPLMTIFIEQAKSGYLLPNTPNWQPVIELGSEAYAAVLEEGQNPSEVVAELTAAINRANGIVTTPTPTPAPPEPETLSDEAAATPSPLAGTTNTDEAAGAGENGETATPSPSP